MYIGFYLLAALAPFGTSLLGVLWVLVAFVILKVRRKFVNIPSFVENSIINRLLWLLLGLSLISVAFSPNIGFSAVFVLGQVLMVGFGVIGSRWLATNPDLADRLLTISLISVILSAIIVLVDSVDALRAQTLFTGVNGTGTILVFFGGLSLAHLWSQPKRWTKPAALLLYVLLLAAILATGSRGAFLGYLAMSFLLIGTNKKALALFVLVIIGTTLVIASDDYYKARFTRFSVDKNLDRVYIWQASVKMIQDKPLVGIGPGQFPFLYKEYKVPAEKQDSVAYAHNIFLQIGAEYGLPALAVFTILIGLVTYYGLRLALTGNVLYKGLFASFVGVMIHQQVDITAWGGNVGSLFWLLSMLIASIYAQEEHRVARGESEGFLLVD